MISSSFKPTISTILLRLKIEKKKKRKGFRRFCREANVPTIFLRLHATFSELGHEYQRTKNVRIKILAPPKNYPENLNYLV